jgi:glutathione S-transferase
MLKIVLGNKNYSSWSLRPWLVLEHFGIPHEEVVVALDQPDTAANIRRYSASGRVPCLMTEGLAIWDSLAICEYLAETNPDKPLWPKDPKARAIARSVSAEMHSGFTSLRNQLSMKFRDSIPRTPSKETQADIDRIVEIWTDARARFGKGGRFLFGDFTIADAFYGPVVSRFKTYGVPLSGAAKDYYDAMWALPAMQKWLADAKAETLRAPLHE